MAVGILARLKIKEGSNEEFETGFKSLQAVVAANEPGNIFYELHRSRESSTTYIVMEQYVDQDAVDAHGKYDEFRTTSASFGSCLAEAPVIELVDAV